VPLPNIKKDDQIKNDEIDGTYHVWGDEKCIQNFGWEA
jgi:hypothetical protein